MHTMGASVTVRLDAPQGLPPVLADRSQLETVLLNLATNARDALSGDGAIIFSASAENIPADHPMDLEPGSLCPSGRRGYRLRDGRADAFARGRTVFHHQGEGQGNGPRAVDGARLR